MGASNVFTEDIMLCRVLSAYTLRVCTCTTSPQQHALEALTQKLATDILPLPLKLYWL